jgi:dipeptidyl aminopeptidase/acylaminoacyl peptidase
MHRFLAGVSLVTVFLLAASAPGIGGVSLPPPRPDGLIVFSCFGCPGGREPGGLSTIQPNGSGLRDIPGTDGDGEPAWSPDGRMLAVTRADGIWLRAADGSHARRLTQRHPQGYDESPAWSPDGKQIVFDRGTPKPAGGGVRRGLWIVAARGGRPRPLLLSPGGQGTPEWSIGTPDWSPDGRRIAFSFGPESERLMVVSVDGGRMLRLGPPMLRGRDPHWSPDGRSIAFLEFSEDGRHRFRILNLANGRVRTVFKSEGEVWVQSWSPDGRWLAIVATRQVECEEVVLDDECESLDLWIVNPTNARRTLIHTFGHEGGDVSGIDWRTSR